MSTCRPKLIFCSSFNKISTLVFDIEFRSHNFCRVSPSLVSLGMESTGIRNKIQVSQKTADLLVAAGKERYLMPRSDTVHAKGKGELQTYWIMPRSSKRRGSSCSTNSNESHGDMNEIRVSFADSPSDSGATEHSSSGEKMAMTRDKSMMGMQSGVSHRSTSSGVGQIDDSASWKDTGIKSGSDEEDGALQPSLLVKRLIKWNAAVLEKYLVKVILVRSVQKQKKGTQGLTSTMTFLRLYFPTKLPRRWTLDILIASRRINLHPSRLRCINESLFSALPRKPGKSFLNTLLESHRCTRMCIFTTLNTRLMVSTESSSNEAGRNGVLALCVAELILFIYLFIYLFGRFITISHRFSMITLFHLVFLLNYNSDDERKQVNE